MHNKLITFSAAAFTIFSADLCTCAGHHLSSRNHCPFKVILKQGGFCCRMMSSIRGLNLDL